MDEEAALPPPSRQGDDDIPKNNRDDVDDDDKQRYGLSSRNAADETCRNGGAHNDKLEGEGGDSSFHPDDDNDDDDDTNELHEGMWSSWNSGRYYNWRHFWRRRRRRPNSITDTDDDTDDERSHSCHWWRTALTTWRFLVRGVDEETAEQTDEDIRRNLMLLARMLILLRVYYETYGMPEDGGPKHQEYVLKEIIIDLYAGGAPVWALNSVMSVVAEGLTGKRGVDFLFLPRKALVFAPTSGATTMFTYQRGFDVSRLEAMEGVAVRLASYATNTHGVVSLRTRHPKSHDLLHAYRKESLRSMRMLSRVRSKEDLAHEILRLASISEGLFFFINSDKRPDTMSKSGGVAATTKEEEDKVTGECKEHGGMESSSLPRRDSPEPLITLSSTDFWNIDPVYSELFSRLATIDADHRIEQIDKERRALYSQWAMTFSRFATAAAACAFWFSGSWYDILVAGICAVTVGRLQSMLLSVTAKEERIIFEAVASYVVGAIAGFAALFFPSRTCFGAMAIAGIMELMQGFRVVFAVVEVMSKHTVIGGADFLEGILYTGLVAYFLRLGRATAASIWQRRTHEIAVFADCAVGIDQFWFFLLVPLGALAWSVSYNPNYRSLPWMTFHGVLAYVVGWALQKTSVNSDLALFVAAMSVTLSSGLVSRWTGRQALGNTVAGLYVLVPGAYMVSQLFTSGSLDFLGSIVVRSAIIGLGAWAGTILCSPTVLGANNGLVQMLKQYQSKSSHHTAPPVGNSLMADPVERNRGVRQNGTGAILFF